jgi:hypothetical protein
MGDSKKLFFLGSGFSKALSSKFPTLQELTKEINNTPFEDTRLKAIWEKLSEKLKNNIEELLSYLLLDNPWEKAIEKSLKKALYFYLIELIQKKLREKSFNPADSQIKNIKEMVQFIQQQGCPVLTMNYDICFEQLVSSLSMKHYHEHTIRKEQNNVLFKVFIKNKYSPEPESRKSDFNKIEKINDEILISINESFLTEKDKFKKLIEGDGSISYYRSNILQDYENYLTQKAHTTIQHDDLYGIPLQRLATRTGAGVFASSYEYAPFHLVKLHGSINWFYSGSYNFPGETIFYSSPYDFERAEKLTLDLQPMMIPPISDKSSHYSHNSLKFLWAQARIYLENAEEIYFIGYSLPQTDLSIRLLLSAAVRPETKIFLINKPANKDEKNDLIKNYSSLFKNIDSKYTDENKPGILDEFIDKEIFTPYSN